MVASLEKINQLKEEFKPGSKFFNWTVLEYKDSINIKCKCDCGVERNFYTSGLRDLNRPSCRACKPSKNISHDPSEEFAIVQTYLSGKHAKDISKEFKIRISEVAYILRKNGFKPREEKIVNNQSKFDLINADVIKKENGVYFVKCRKCNYERGVSITHITPCSKCSGKIIRNVVNDRLGKKFGTRTIIEYKNRFNVVYLCDCGHSAKTEFTAIKEAKYGCVMCYKENREKTKNGYQS